VNRRGFAVGLATWGVGAATPGAPSTAQTQLDVEKHIAWVGEVYDRMIAIKPGMTRKQMLAVFRLQVGGLRSPLYAVHVSRECPYFKVIVELEAVGRPQITSVEADDDVIVKISTPYLEQGEPAD
jgi:hypothetical protein